MGKRYWILIILGVILLPLVLNWLILDDTPSCFVFGRGVVGGDEAQKVWLGFWATYIGAVASFTMVYFTYKTLQQNQKVISDVELSLDKIQKGLTSPDLITKIPTIQQSLETLNGNIKTLINKFENNDTK